MRRLDFVAVFLIAAKNIFDLLLLRPCCQYGSPVQAFLGPPFGCLVVLGHGRNVRWNDNPGLLRGSIDVDVGRKAIRFIKRTHTDETNHVACPTVVAPKRDVTFRAAGNLLALAAVRRCVDDFNFVLEQVHTISFDQRIEGERSSTFSLAPAAMATVDEQRICRHAIAHEPTSATSVKKFGFAAHGSIFIANLIRDYTYLGTTVLKIYGPNRFSPVFNPWSTLHVCAPPRLKSRATLTKPRTLSRPQENKRELKS